MVADGRVGTAIGGDERRGEKRRTRNEKRKGNGSVGEERSVRLGEMRREILSVPFKYIIDRGGRTAGPCP